MIKNFFKIAIRNILRHKGFTFINVTGLAVGLAASLLIILWVQDEFSFEKYIMLMPEVFREIIIACLGLYGLSSYSAQRRTNEVGIRKVMGADSFTVMYTLAKEFLYPVLISILIAVPLGWIIVSKLLKQFAYRIEISFWIFALISVVAIFIALATVSFHAYKETGINPAEALKVE